ncbi:hypothetical protein [Accumulibacter sp.]|uniref:hypothetical protein n=1 Tax=Accumulibacter sp. TaxID=2053492 RepID=UPI00261EF9E9|nr:hypothetical protein [Accumulibacter sp.]
MAKSSLRQLREDLAALAGQIDANLERREQTRPVSSASCFSGSFARNCSVISPGRAVLVELTASALPAGDRHGAVIFR